MVAAMAEPDNGETVATLGEDQESQLLTRRGFALNTLPPSPSTEVMRIHTSKLDLVPITHEHAAEMLVVLTDPSLYEFTGGSPPSDVAALALQYEFWERRTAPDGSELWLNWAVRERETDTFIGHVQAGVAANCTSIAWLIGTKWQRRGYASEATKAMVEWLIAFGVTDIRASINPAHSASIKVAERVGLKSTDLRDCDEIVWRKVV